MLTGKRLGQSGGRAPRSFHEFSVESTDQSAYNHDYMKGEASMDFLERLAGISPDGGSGWLELGLLAALMAAPVLYSILRRRRSRT